MHETWWSILTSPAHVIAEIIISAIWDIIIFALGYVFARKKIWQKLHERFDKEHDIKH